MSDFCSPATGEPLEYRTSLANCSATSIDLNISFNSESAIEFNTFNFVVKFKTVYRNNNLVSYFEKKNKPFIRTKCNRARRITNLSSNSAVKFLILTNVPFLFSVIY